MKNSNVKENLYISLVVVVLVACLVGSSLLAFGFNLNSNSKVASAYYSPSGKVTRYDLTEEQINTVFADYFTYDFIGVKYYEADEPIFTRDDALANINVIDDFRFKDILGLDSTSSVMYYSFQVGVASTDWNENFFGYTGGDFHVFYFPLWTYTSSSTDSLNMIRAANIFYSADSDSYTLRSPSFEGGYQLYCYSHNFYFSFGAYYNHEDPSAGYGYWFPRFSSFSVYVMNNSSIYDVGYDSGYDSGYDKGYQQGYKDTYQSAYDEGYNQGAIDVLQETPIATFNTLNIVPYSNESLKMGGYSIKTTDDGSQYFGDKLPAIIVTRTGDSYKPAMKLNPGITLKSGRSYSLKFDGAGPLGNYASGNSIMLGGLSLNNEYMSIDGMSQDSNYLSISFTPSVDLSALVLSYNVSVPEFAVSNPRLYVFDATIQDIIDSAYDRGQTTGYDDGFRAGNNQGYNKGYAQGVNDSGEYTFMGLIGAVVDAPVSAFRQMFNFEILGVNLSSFFMAMLTACLIIVIIRIVLGGK